MGIEELKEINEWVKPKELVWCLVRSDDYCESGYCVACWNGNKWLTDSYDDITEYVTAYLEINEP